MVTYVEGKCKLGHENQLVQRKGRREGDLRCYECARIQRRSLSAQNNAKGLTANGTVPSLKHHPDIEVRFLRHVDQRYGVPEINPEMGSCWAYVDSKSDYPGFHNGEKGIRAHRFSYEYYVGPIPEGFEIDHLCKVTRCVRPSHLEAVTPRVNTLRSSGPSALHAVKTHCPQGHPYDEVNTYCTPTGSRQCRECRRAHDRKRAPKRTKKRIVA